MDGLKEIRHALEIGRYADEEDWCEYSPRDQYKGGEVFDKAFAALERLEAEAKQQEKVPGDDEILVKLEEIYYPQYFQPDAHTSTEELAIVEERENQAKIVIDAIRADERKKTTQEVDEQRYKMAYQLAETLWPRIEKILHSYIAEANQPKIELE
jgi:hypothetical protein